jgi:hypothetical protein
MAKTKAELEADVANYFAQMQAANAAIGNGDIAGAVVFAVSSLPFVDGMMRYQRKYHNVEFASVDAIDVVLANAPVLLDAESLEQINSLLNASRSIEKNTSVNLGERLAAARTMLRDAYAIWELFDQESGVLDSNAWMRVPCEMERWSVIVNAWTSFGLLRQVDNGARFQWATSMDAIVQAKCPLCGVLVKAPKHRLLDEAGCPSCRAKAWFVLVSGS